MSVLNTADFACTLTTPHQHQQADMSPSRQVSGKPAKETRKFVTAHNVPEDLLADVVSDFFAEDHEGVKLISSDGSDVDISLKDVVKGLQEDDSYVPGISQESTAKTALILVGRPLRPKATQQGVFAYHSKAMAAPGMPAAQVCKRGRVRTQDQAKSQLGQKQSEQLSIQAGNLMRLCAHALCSREAEAPGCSTPLLSSHSSMSSSRECC